ncbi:hypothetical protein F4775DRAFT_311384 [Biscogniauxia sp. FL1348]|nr:hypothetical protein F4775DRAFT_311384 [Biscogniauxia sp. FL1348]
MAPPQISKTSAEPTLYEILALTPKHLEGQAAPAQQKVVKQAYHRALLKHHPDKKSTTTTSTSTSKPKPTKPSPSPSSSSSSSSPHGIVYTVDQIQHAYAVLSDRKQRAEYDRSLRLHPHPHQQGDISSFHTGVETVDLDDVGFDERTGVYHRGCRCGNARGYAFTEENLAPFEDDGVLMVECRDCSLWLRVLFAAAAEVDDEEAVSPQPPPQPMPGGGGGISVQVQGLGLGLGLGKGVEEEEVVRRRGSSAGEAEGRGWKFNWSFSWGISVSGSASASASAGSGAGARIGSGGETGR